MAAMTNLANSMQASAVRTTQAMERLGKPARNGNANREGVGNNLGGALMTIATFLKTQHISDTQFVEFAAYQLIGEAQYWWQGECRLLQLQNTDIPWELFQTTFYREYFLESMRKARELELMQLKQGSMFVTEYSSKFVELYRFSRECQGTPESYEGWKCIKY
ncbi:uncharacterized protein LOC107607454 [Arachis ipaensis]|uniref:uncharacterized protein LOC107607454 n=1 Tax=Arachis ipaensis TaxID=130454 RepID=UPI0007AEFAE9|nr:uncharacterized protein LOC107607454 [Arachis ipaensis]